MNVKEAKDVLSRVSSEYMVYCDAGNNVEWFESGKSVGDVLWMIESAEPIKTFAFQKGTTVYEAVYAQVFDAKKIVLMHAKRGFVDNVVKFYLVPLGKTIKIEEILPKASGGQERKSMGMGGLGRGRLG